MQLCKERRGNVSLIQTLARLCWKKISLVSGPCNCPMPISMLVMLYCWQMLSNKHRLVQQIYTYSCPCQIRWKLFIFYRLVFFFFLSIYKQPVATLNLFNGQPGSFILFFRHVQFSFSSARPVKKKKFWPWEFDLNLPVWAGFESPVCADLYLKLP